MPQSSTFLIGSYRDGKWVCACDRPPAWRVVSKEGPTKGQRFLRCNPTGSQPQCSFFLWEVHEASARNQITSRTRSSSLQTTPIRSPNSSRALPTPLTSDSRRSGRLTSTRAPSSPTASRRILNQTSTPTRSRGRNDWDDEDDENDDYSDVDYSDDEGVLTERITDCLISDGLDLRVSTGNRVDRIVREEFAAYRAKLDERDETIAKLTQRLERFMARADR